MRNNPCRYCILHEKYHNRFQPGESEECCKCKNLAAHRAYLKDQRMYKDGAPITDIKDLLNQKWVMLLGKPKHISFILSMQLMTVMHLLNKRVIHRAVFNECRAAKENKKTLMNGLLSDKEKFFWYTNNKCSKDDQQYKLEIAKTMLTKEKDDNKPFFNVLSPEFCKNCNRLKWVKAKA